MDLTDLCYNFSKKSKKDKKMKKISVILFLIVFKGFLMAAVVENIEVKNIKVPIIYEHSKLIPAVSIQIVFKGSGAINDKDKPGLAYLSALMLNEGTNQNKEFL
jgi:predicted Zn-dependent peptidase